MSNPPIAPSAARTVDGVTLTVHIWPMNVIKVPMTLQGAALLQRELADAICSQIKEELDLKREIVSAGDVLVEKASTITPPKPDAPEPEEDTKDMDLDGFIVKATEILSNVGYYVDKVPPGWSRRFEPSSGVYLFDEVDTNPAPLGYTKAGTPRKRRPKQPRPKAANKTRLRAGSKKAVPTRKAVTRKGKRR